MKVQLESTDKIVELKTASGVVPARIWEGHTENGIACHAFVTRIAVSKDLDASEFERELQEHRPPSPEISRAYDLRLVI